VVRLLTAGVSTTLYPWVSTVSIRTLATGPDLRPPSSYVRQTTKPSATGLSIVYIMATPRFRSSAR
jgi:hypothetical protein